MERSLKRGQHLQRQEIMAFIDGDKGGEIVFHKVVAYF